MDSRACKELWFCRFADAVIVLDVRRDRYFQMSPPQACALLQSEAGNEVLEPAAYPESALRDRFPSRASMARRHIMPRPARSALEFPSTPQRLALKTIIDTGAAVSSALVRLKTATFSNALSSLSRCKARYASCSAPDAASELQLVEAARSFNRARLLIPIEPSCLLDSLALSAFLARKGLPSTLVVGVTCNPFSAHSWVQSGDLVLNDTVGGCSLYTPIGIF